MFYFVMQFMCVSWREEMPLEQCTLIVELYICTRYVKLTLEGLVEQYLIASVPAKCSTQ